VVQDGIIQLAMDKLAARTVGKYEADSFLAAISVRLMLNFRAPEDTCSGGRESHGCRSSAGSKCHTCSSRICDFIVAEAAAQVLRSKHGRSPRSECERGTHREGSTRGTCRPSTAHTCPRSGAGEHGSQGQSRPARKKKKLYTSPTVVAFFRALFSQRYVDNLLCHRADNSPGGPTFEKAFDDAYVIFTHFGKAADDWCMSHAFMFMVLFRNMAISCREGMEYVDLCAFLSPFAAGCPCPRQLRV